MGHGARAAHRVTSGLERRRGLPFAGAAFAAAAVLVAVGWTDDHTELERSEPPKDSVVAEAPSQVVLDYTTEVQLALSTVVVHGQAQAPAAAGELAYLADDRRDVLVLPLAQPLPDGAYQVAWNTAGPDGHAISGDFGFEVVVREGEAAAQEATDTTGEAAGVLDDDDAAPETGESAVGSAGSPPAPTALASAATRFVFYLGVVGLWGAVAFRLLVAGALAREGSREVYQAAVGRAWKVAALSAGAVLASAPFRLWFQVQAFSSSDPAPGLGGILTATPWGMGWMLHVGLGLLAAAAVALSQKRGLRASGWAVAGLSALLLPVVPVVSGHAWSAEPRSLAAPVLYLHVAAASVWIGGLCCVLFAGLPAVKRHAENAEGAGLAAMVAAFSRVAVVAVALLAASGTVNAWVHLEAFSQLWTTAWGRALLVKLTVVAGVMALGLYNWRVVRPALAESPRPGLLALPAVVEVALAGAALAATSWLVAQPLA